MACAGGIRFHAAQVRRPCGVTSPLFSPLRRRYFDIRLMTPIKFVLRYTAIPFAAIVAVVVWAVVPSSKEIDARQYAALSRAYASFPLPFRHEISEAMDDGRISDRRYQTLVRDSLGNGVALDWPASGVADVAAERQRLTELLKADSGLEEHQR
ncbi:hypothetical protein Bamb_6550 [Burkholderia ambifaria AMMD]|uniref:Uncharacterized protein n=2 Tax=Burkholderia ambifaria TaxID=152480 RepID=Q0B179_BURCM|nr:hypothetical protein Bamb_6550 [Burkholderia ambifaria AMMD]